MSKDLEVLSDLNFVCVLGTKSVIKSKYKIVDSAVARIVWSSWHVLKKPVVGVWAAFPCAAVVSSVTVSVCAIPEILHVIQTSTYQLWRITSCVGSFLRAAAWICVHIWHTLSRFGGAISFETYFCHGRGNTGFTPHTCGGKNPKHVLKSDSLYKCDVHALFSLPGRSHLGHIDDQFACLFLRWLIPTLSLGGLTF